MTEIEKSMRNMKDEIDLNGLADELQGLFDGLMIAFMKGKVGEGKDVKPEELSILVMQAVNAFVNKIDVDQRLIPIVCAGVDAWAELIKGTLDEDHANAVDALVENVLNNSSVWVKKSKKRRCTMKKAMKRWIDRILDLLCMWLGLDCQARRADVDAGICDFSGQGRDTYGR